MAGIGRLGRAIVPGEPSRLERARAQGFDPRRWYHGTRGVEGEGIKFFERSRMGQRTDEGFLGKGVYSSSDPEIASSYSSFGAGQPAVYPLRTRGNYLKLKEAPEDYGDMFARRRRVREALDLPDDADAQDIADAARSQGYDGIEWEFDDSPYTPGGVLEQVTFDPENIRSEFAEFDPEQVGSAYISGQADPRLLAPLAGGAVAATAAQDAEAGPMGALAKAAGIPTRRAHHAESIRFDAEEAAGDVGWLKTKLRKRADELEASATDQSFDLLDKDAVVASIRNLADQDDYLRHLVDNPEDISLDDNTFHVLQEKYDSLAKPAGHLYEVEIPDESLMLDWDKPLSEQPENV
jgi:hypothetical protein